MSVPSFVRPSLVPLTVIAVVAAFLIVAGTAAAKENMVATLTSPLPTNAQPGTNITLTWEVAGPGEGGQRMPFNAAAVFVRLKSATGRASTEGFASFLDHSDGRYTATVIVPQGGIGGVEIGVHGTREYSSGKTERSDYLFPVVNPAGQQTAGSVWTSWVRWLLAAALGAVLLATGAALVAGRARRSVRPTLT